MKKRLIISNVIVVFISLMALLVTVCFVTNNLNDKQIRNEIFKRKGVQSKYSEWFAIKFIPEL